MSRNIGIKRSHRRSRSGKCTTMVVNNNHQSLCVMFLFLLCCICHALAYSPIYMEYKPPVKTSVGKLSRFGKDPTNNEYSSDNNNPSRSSKLGSYASGALAAPDNMGVGSRFERRMRDLVFGGSKNKKKSPPQRVLPSNIKVIESLSEYKTVVADEKERMVIVRFFAPWCRACKAVEPLFYRMAKQNPQSLFVDVPVTEMNANLHQGLGVERLPFCHVYHPTSGLVEELRFTKSHFKSTVTIFETYLQGFCPLEVDKETGLFSSPYKR